MGSGGGSGEEARRSLGHRFGARLTDSQLTSISGAVSGFTATVAKQPVQRLKWIRQVDSGPSQPYMSVLRRTWQTDGILGLFRGSGAAICRNVPHSAIVYTIYPMAERAVLSARGGDAPVLALRGSGETPIDALTGKPKVGFGTRFWAGYATLFGATLVTHPLDTIRVRISVRQGSLSVREVIAPQLQPGKWRGLYHGFGVTLLGAGPRGAIGFGVFETLKERLRGFEAQRQHPALAKFFYGYMAGFCAETAIYPLDTVRRRQQALGDATPLSRQGVVGALMHVARQEGVAGLYKGLPLNLLKNPVATAFSFAINDLVKDFLGHGEKRGEKIS